MLEKDIEYANKTLDRFVDAAINRIAETGELVQHFKIPDAQLKAATGRTRLKDSLIDDYVDFYEASNVPAEHIPQHGHTLVKLDLRTAILDPGQAAGLSQALNIYRMNNN